MRRLGSFVSSAASRPLSNRCSGRCGIPLPYLAFEAGPGSSSHAFRWSFTCFAPQIFHLDSFQSSCGIRDPYVPQWNMIKEDTARAHPPVASKGRSDSEPDACPKTDATEARRARFVICYGRSEMLRTSPTLLAHVMCAFAWCRRNSFFTSPRLLLAVRLVV